MLQRLTLLCCSGWAVVCMGLVSGHGSVQAQLRPSPAPTFDAAPTTQPPIRMPALTAPAMRADPAAPPMPDMSVSRPVLRLPGSDNPALDTAVERLRASALATSLPGQRGSRNAANASWVLGLLYVHGIGVVTNLADAAYWFARANALGEPLASAGLAWCAIEGCTSAPTPEAARRSVNALRRIQLPRAQYLQWLMESRLMPLQIAAPGMAPGHATSGLPNRQLLVSAAQGGDIHAAIELGLESLGASRKEEALMWFRTAAPRSAAAAANVALLTGPINKSQAPSGSQEASETLARAQRNHRGDGQPANFVEAIRLYRLAQSQGSQQARKMIELIFSRPGADGQIDIGWMQQLSYINLSNEVAVVGSSTERRAFRREVTPLVDLLPPVWKKYVPGNLNVSAPAPGRPQ